MLYNNMVHDRSCQYLQDLSVDNSNTYRPDNIMRG